MASSNLIYDATVGRQDGDATLFNFVRNYDATNQAATTGNTFKFASDRDRMSALLGSRGLSRTSGYYNYLYARYYNMTVTDPDLPSDQGPGSYGWGAQIGNGQPLNPVFINNASLLKSIKQQYNVLVTVEGYIYAPVPTTFQFKTITDDGISVRVNGSSVINNWSYHGPATDDSGPVILHPGYNPIQIYFFQGSIGCLLDFQVRIGKGPWITDFSCLAYHNYNQL